jgi:hypothetical protein
LLARQYAWQSSWLIEVVLVIPPPVRARAVTVSFTQPMGSQPEAVGVAVAELEVVTLESVNRLVTDNRLDTVD